MAYANVNTHQENAARSLNPWFHNWHLPAHEIPALATIAIFSLIAAIAVASGVFTFSHADFDGLILTFALLWLLGHLRQLRHGGVVPDLCKLYAVFLGVALASPMACAALATTNFPLADATLTQLDHQLVPGFSWPSTVQALERYPQILHLLSYAYVALGWQPPVLLALLYCQGRKQEAWKFINAWTLCILVTTLIFPFAPALNPYTFHAIPHSAMPDALCTAAWDYPIILKQLRAHSITTLNSAALSGLVSFPSFHAAGAVLLAWGYGKIRYLRWLFLAINAIMWVSAIPIGGHYLVDLVAGTGLALLMIGFVEGTAVPRPLLKTPAQARGDEALPMSSPRP